MADIKLDVKEPKETEKEYVQKLNEVGRRSCMYRCYQIQILVQN